MPKVVRFSTLSLRPFLIFRLFLDFFFFSFFRGPASVGEEGGVVTPNGWEDSEFTEVFESDMIPPDKKSVEVLRGAEAVTEGK